jgi:hypothetical protein
MAYWAWEWPEENLVTKESSLPSVTMVCFIAIIPLLVRSQTGDFDKPQEATGMSNGLLGMRVAWGKASDWGVKSAKCYHGLFHSHYPTVGEKMNWRLQQATGTMGMPKGLLGMTEAWGKARD